MLVKSDQHRYGRLVQELANDFNKGLDSYPKTLTEAYELMLNDVRDQDNRSHPQGDPGVSFSNVEAATGVPNTGGTPGSNTQPNRRPMSLVTSVGRPGTSLTSVPRQHTRVGQPS
jgi:hypothetical protein